MVTVGDDDASCFSATGTVNCSAGVLGVLDEALDGGGVGADQGDDAVHGDHVAVADIDEEDQIRSAVNQQFGGKPKLKLLNMMLLDS